MTRPTPEQLEHRRQWVAALRSGKYAQARKGLHDGRGFCCLGVANEISGLGAWDRRPGTDEDGAVWHDYEVHDADEEDEACANDDQEMHPAVADWLGLDDLNPDLNETPAADLNDGSEKRCILPHTFNQIADLIEAEYIKPYEDGS